MSPEEMAAVADVVELIGQGARAISLSGGDGIDRAIDIKASVVTAAISVADSLRHYAKYPVMHDQVVPMLQRDTGRLQAWLADAPKGPEAS